MPHSSTRGEGGVESVPVAFFDFVEPSLMIEVPTRLRENAGRRFGGWFCGSFGEVAAANWLGERKSENEDAVLGTGRVVCPGSVVRISRGLPASEELGGLSTRASAPRLQLISSRQHTNCILPLLLDPLIIWRKAVPHGGIDCAHWGQAATELFSWFTLVQATLGIAEVVPAGVRVVTGACEAERQTMGVLKRGSGHYSTWGRVRAYSIEVSPMARHDLVGGWVRGGGMSGYRRC